MKLHPLIAIALAAALPAIAFGVTPKVVSPATTRADVTFLEPEKFTDVRASLSDTRDRYGYLDQLREYIGRVSLEYVPEGHRLLITFTDIDLAGDFPPARSAAMDNIRVMKMIYPPRMVFSYRVTDVEGKVVKQGKEELTDMNYLTTMSLTDRGDVLRYDKALLSDWFRKEFGKK